MNWGRSCKSLKKWRCSTNQKSTTCTSNLKLRMNAFKRQRTAKQTRRQRPKTYMIGLMRPMSASRCLSSRLRSSPLSSKKTSSYNKESNKWPQSKTHWSKTSSRYSTTRMTWNFWLRTRHSRWIRKTRGFSALKMLSLGTHMRLSS